MSHRSYWLFFLALTGLAGCSFEHNKAPEDLAVSASPQRISFSRIESGIFQPKCSRCHGGPDGAGGVDLSSYDSILQGRGLVQPGTPSRSLVYTEVESGRMPKGGPKLPDAEIKMIADWISQGAANN